MWSIQVLIRMNYSDWNHEKVEICLEVIKKNGDFLLGL